MKILKSEDCEVTDPPCTCFIFFPECESDLAFLAELVDLPTVNRAVPYLIERVEKDRIPEIVSSGQTSRITVQSFAAHLGESPSTSEEYTQTTIKSATSTFGIEQQVLLEKAFWVRTFWF